MKKSKKELSALEKEILQKSLDLNKYYGISSVIKRCSKLFQSIEADEYYESNFRNSIMEPDFSIDKAIRHYGYSLFYIGRYYTMIDPEDLKILESELDAYSSDVRGIIRFLLESEEVRTLCNQTFEVLNKYVKMSYKNSKATEKMGNASLMLLRKVANGHLDAISDDDITNGSCMFLNCNLNECMNGILPDKNPTLVAYAYNGQMLEVLSLDYWNYQYEKVVFDKPEENVLVSGDKTFVKKVAKKSNSVIIKKYFD